jgi:hypothetical protein
MYTPVEQPDGPLYVAFLEDANPYKDMAVDNNSIIAGLELQKKVFVVKMCSICDFVTNMVLGTLGHNSISFVFAFMSYSGYFGANTYNIKLLRLYLYYQYIVVFFRFFTLICILLNALHIYTLKGYIAYNLIDYSDVIIMTMFACIQTVVCWNVVILHRLMPLYEPSIV